MSIPQNILGKFNTYAYHHILMVCNNTEAAEELTNTSEITTFQHPITAKRYAPRQIGDDEKNKYVTLIDGTSDARFYITSATWENVIAMENYVDDGGIPQSTSMSVEGELEIMEPLGANFLNVLTKVCDDLNTDPVGLVFVLKTIFVGHNQNGSSEMISNVKPLLFIIYDITAIFDTSGAKYKILLVGAVNGLGKLPQTQKIFKGFAFKINPEHSLAETFENLAIKVNESYEVYKNQAKADFAKTLYDASKKEGDPLTAQDSATKARKFFDSNYRSVVYKIIADDYTNKKYKAGDNESIRVANKRNDGSFNFGCDLGVEAIIKKLMASSTGVINDSKNTESKQRYIYKIVSGLSSTSDSFIVKYYVKRYKMLMLPFEAAFEGEEFIPEPGQSIEFNYIFTGKNVDIKSFDIKMEMGMAFFQIAATTDSLPIQETTKDGINSQAVQTEGSASVASNNKTRRSKTPLFLGSTISQPMSRNTKNPVDSASFQALLNRHAALENIGAKMIIFGNPQLLNEMHILPSDLINEQTEKPKQNETINPKWLNTPTLIKVNIKMPVDTNDFNTEYRDFWYTGYYTLFSVKQIFNEGEFLQELEMISLPVSDKTQESTDKSSTVEVDKEKDKAVYREILKQFDITAPKKVDDDVNKTDGDKTDGDKVTVKLSRLDRGRLAYDKVTDNN